MKKVLFAILFTCLFCISASVPARAQDAALSKEALTQLGITSAQLAQLKVVNEKATISKGALAGLTITKVLFANAGGNRFLWRIDFAGKVPADDSNIILYVNTDADETTGRRDYQGIDLMVWAADGTGRTALYTPQGQVTDGPPAYVAISGNQLYISVDIDLHQENGATVLPMRIIAQTAHPLKGQSSTPFFTLRGAPMSKEAKMERVEKKLESENVVFMRGLQEMRKMRADANNIWFSPQDAEMKGWRIWQHAKYDTTATLTSGRGSFKITVPRDGTFYPSFIWYDEAPERAAIDIFINGQQRGRAVTVDADNDQKLFALQTSVALKKGDTVELRNANNVGKFRIEGILLLKNLFPKTGNQYEFKYVKATRPWQNPELMRITFTTSWPAQVKVLFGESEKLGREVSEDDIPLNNHRIYLHDLKEGQKYFYRLSSENKRGEKVLSSVQSFTFRKPQYPPAIAATQHVPLRLSPLPRGVWPVNSGVPLPQGAVYESQNLRLLNAGNQPLATQKRVLARWHDGSIKWVLCSFVADGSQANYQLEYGRQINDQTTTNIASQTGGNIAVNTGALQWQATANAAGGYDVSLNGAQKVLLSDAQIVVTDESGKRYSDAFAPDKMRLEENGAQRAVVVARGKLANADKSTFFAYEVRWFFTRGSSVARLRVTLINDQVKSTFSHLQSAVVQFKLPASNGEITLADVGTSSGAANVIQTYDDTFTAQTSSGTKSGKRFAGWMEWQNGAQKISLAVRNFWQLYPKAIGVKDDVLEVGLAPAVTKEEYARFKGTTEEYRSVFYLMDGNYKLRAGVSFTTEIALDLGSQNGAALQDYTNAQPVLIASPEYYRDAKAFGDVGLGDGFPIVQEYNKKVASSFVNYLKDRDNLHEYGLMNFGDWWGERSINWGNVEYDTQHAFIMQFARSGDLGFLRAAEDAAIHNRDIDTVHVNVAPPEKYLSIGGTSYDERAASIGRVWEHSVGHTGGYFKLNPVTGKPPTSHYDATGMLDAVASSSHTWTEGHYEYYFLTGDNRSLQTANQIADVYDTYGTIGYDFGNMRVPGWLLIFTMGAYDATDDPFYLNAAHIVMDRVIDRQTPDGGWNRQLGGGHCRDNPPHSGNAGFMVGIAMSGMKYYAESTGDQRAKDSIVKAAHFLINDMWVPQAKAFRYTSCPNTNPAPGLNLLIGEGISYAWRQTHDPQLRRVALDAMETTVANMNGMGKNITMELRTTPRQLFDIEQMLKIPEPVSASMQAKVPAAGQGSVVQFAAQAKTLKGVIQKYFWDFGDGSNGEGARVSHDYPNGGNYLVTLQVTNSAGEKATHSSSIYVQPPALQKVNPQTDVMIEAENFTAQGGGGNDIEIVDGRVNTSGKAITKWERNLGHWAEWKFEVPQDGNYHLILKYASGSSQTERAIQVDGNYPNDALQKVLLPGTGGYSQGADNWKVWKLLDNARKPLQMHLTKGTHTLRISNLSGGMALDFVLVQKS